MIIRPLHDMNRAQMELIHDSLRFDKVGKPNLFKGKIEKVIQKVKLHGNEAELTESELNMIARGLINKAQLLSAVYGLGKKKKEKHHMYDLAYTIQCRRAKIKEASTAGTANAS